MNLEGDNLSEITITCKKSKRIIWYKYVFDLILQLDSTNCSDVLLATSFDS